MSNPRVPKAHGCFFYGCIITLVVGVLGVLGTYLAIRHVIRKTILTYTETAPVALPEVEAARSEIEGAQRRWSEFFDAVINRKPVPPLILSEHDLNGLILGTGTNRLSGKLVVVIDGDQLKARASLPLDRLNVQALRGRYLNGTILVKVGLNQGGLVVQPESIRVRNQPLPDWLQSRIRHQNWAQQLMNNSAAAATINNLESIIVTNGTVVITPNRAGGEPADQQ